MSLHDGRVSNSVSVLVWPYVCNLRTYKNRLNESSPLPHFAFLPIFFTQLTTPLACSAEAKRILTRYTNPSSQSCYDAMSTTLSLCSFCSPLLDSFEILAWEHPLLHLQSAIMTTVIYVENLTGRHIASIIPTWRRHSRRSPPEDGNGYEPTAQIFWHK